MTAFGLTTKTTQIVRRPNKWGIKTTSGKCYEMKHTYRYTTAKKSSTNERKKKKPPKWKHTTNSLKINTTNSNFSSHRKRARARLICDVLTWCSVCFSKFFVLFVVVAFFYSFLFLPLSLHSFPFILVSRNLSLSAVSRGLKRILFQHWRCVFGGNSRCGVSLIFFFFCLVPFQFCSHLALACAQHECVHGTSRFQWLIYLFSDRTRPSQRVRCYESTILFKASRVYTCDHRYERRPAKQWLKQMMSRHHHHRLACTPRYQSMCVFSADWNFDRATWKRKTKTEKISAENDFAVQREML